MPNWCHNRVTITGEPDDLARFKGLISTEDHPFDFNKILPMPVSLNITAGSSEMGYRAVYGDFQGLLNYPWIAQHGIETRQELINFFWRAHPDLMENVERYRENKNKYGHLNWYSWRIANWGTKWDVSPDDILVVCDEVDFIQLEFDTAWSPAEGIHQKITELIDEHNLSVSITWFYDEPGMAMAGYL